MIRSGTDLTPNARLPQRRPIRLTGPPRFMGVPRRRPKPGAPIPGVATARATGATGRTTHPLGTPTVLQKTTAWAGVVEKATVSANKQNPTRVESQMRRIAFPFPPLSADRRAFHHGS